MRPTSVKDTLMVIDGTEIITYITNEVRSAIDELSKQKIVIPYGKFDVRKVTDGVIENSIYDVLINDLGLHVSCVRNNSGEFFNIVDYVGNKLHSLSRYVQFIIYGYLTQLLLLDVNKNYYAKAMTVNTNIHILISH
jgi:hypothetical protein